MGTKKRKRYFSVIFVPDQERNPKSMSLSYDSGKLILILIGFLAIHLVMGGVGYTRWYTISKERNALKLENSELIRQNKKINQIADEHQKNKMITERMLKAFGVSLGVSSEEDDLLATESEKNMPNISRKDAASQIPTMELNLPVQNRLPYLVIKPGDFYNPENVPTRLPVEGFLTTRFQEGGWVLSRRHLGIDIDTNIGTPIRAAGSGIVIFAGWTPDWGNLVILSHQNGYYTYYGHASHVKVEVGTTVERGGVIALIGSSGISSGPHLHFEIWRNGKPIDPEEVIYTLQKHSKNDN